MMMGEGAKNKTKKWNEMVLISRNNILDKNK